MCGAKAQRELRAKWQWRWDAAEAAAAPVAQRGDGVGCWRGMRHWDAAGMQNTVSPLSCVPTSTLTPCIGRTLRRVGTCEHGLRALLCDVNGVLYVHAAA